jgi:hypothetical protein
MDILILLDWNHPLNRRPMNDARRWTAAHGFEGETQYRNADGDSLAELLDREPDAKPGGTVYPRWTFCDGSAVVMGQSSWRISKPDDSGLPVVLDGRVRDR